MKNRLLVLSLVTISLLLSGQFLFAEKQNSDRIFGRELMTDDEVIIHREKMISLETREERQAYRKKHHKEMQERAKEKGVELQDPPQPGMGSEGASGGKKSNRY